jgi:Fe-S-cluster-containing dehydrogenase component
MNTEKGNNYKENSVTCFMVHSLCLACMECNPKCRQVNAVNADGEVVAKLYLFLISVRDEYELCSSSPGLFFAGGKLRYRLNSNL